MNHVPKTASRAEFFSSLLIPIGAEILTGAAREILG